MKTLEDKFWSRVSKGNGCWEWVGSRHRAGYGQMSILGRKTRATRILWKILGRELLPGQLIMHKCDNPPCVRPDHLAAATMKENMMDMVAKGRHLKNQRLGSSHGSSKLTESNVSEIRRMRPSKNFNSTELAKRFGVDPSLIRKISKGIGWNHVKPAIGQESEC